METVLSDLRKELAQERERNKKLQEDLTSLTERETRISKALASVIIFDLFIFISFNLLCISIHKI